jgi:hypothetical protein
MLPALSTKKFLLVIITLFAALAGNAQDLIVTRGGDSINCRITRSNNMNVTVQYADSTGQVLNQVIRREELKDAFKNFYSTPAFTPQQAKATQLGGYRVAVNAGYSYQFGKVIQDNDIKKPYLEKLRSGFGCGLDLAWFFTKDFGLGLRYSFFTTSGSGGYPKAIEDTSYIVTFDDHIYIHSVGPEISFRIPLAAKSNSFFIGTMFAGWSFFLNQGDKTDIPIKFTGNCFNIGMAAGVDFRLAKRIGLGFEISFGHAQLQSYTAEYNSKSENIATKIWISHLDLTAGIRFLK